MGAEMCIRDRSHPVWVRGLKSLLRYLLRCWSSVAPRVGAWIEIMRPSIRSALSAVAPRVGAWIEIITIVISFPRMPVAPRVGAWIEIGLSCNKANILYVAPRVGGASARKSLIIRGLPHLLYVTSV